MHTIDEVKSQFDAGLRVIFIDARTDEAWMKSPVQIPGSIRVSPDRPDEFTAVVPRYATIVTYCTCPQERSSNRVARALQDRGWRNVHTLFGGFNGWVARGYPTESKQLAPQAGWATAGR